MSRGQEVVQAKQGHQVTRDLGEREVSAVNRDKKGQWDHQ